MSSLLTGVLDIAYYWFHILLPFCSGNLRDECCGVVLPELPELPPGKGFCRGRFVLRHPFLLPSRILLRCIKFFLKFFFFIFFIYMYPFKDRLGPVLAQYDLADILPDRGAQLAQSALRVHSPLLGRRDVVHVLWAPTRP